MTALARAAAATRARPELWIVALGGFLARGGIVLLILPMMPVPSTVGLATLVGPTSVTAAGLTPDSVVRLVIVVTLAVAWLLAGSAVGAVADSATVGGFGPAAPSSQPAPSSRARRIARLVALRFVALVPLIVVVAVSARSVGELVYQELVLPRDVAAPLVLRVVEGAQVQVAAIGLAWIVGEVFGGIAVRLAIVDDRSFGRAIGGAFVHVVRHPRATLVATFVGLVGLIAAVAPGIVLAGAAWDSLGRSVAGAIDGRAVAGATVVLVAVWVGWAAVAAIVAAFRGALWTAELARTR